MRQWEAVQLTLEELVHELCATLGHAGLGATELALELATSDRPPGAPPERLVLSLVGRLGGDAVCVWRALETHVPERAYRARPLLQADDSPTRGRGGAARPCTAPRPSLLFAQPERAECRTGTRPPLAQA